MEVEEARRQFDGRYVEACKEVGVLPDDEVLQVGKDMSSLTLNGRGGGEKAVIALAKALQGRGTFSSITIRDSFMGCAGSAALCNALLTCPILPTRLDFTGANIKADGTLHLASLIMHTPLTELTLEWNSTGIDIPSFAELMISIGSSASLQYLDLRHNHISSTACRALAEMLHVNKSLTTLDLRWNQITAQGSAALAAGMAANTSLLVMHLSGNDMQFCDLTTIDSIVSANKTRRQVSPPRKHIHKGSASPDATYRWARSGAANVLSPQEPSVYTRYVRSTSPKLLRDGHMTYLTTPHPPSTEGDVSTVRVEAMQQRNEELATEMLELREQLSEQSKTVDALQLAQMQHNEEIASRDSTAQVLEKRVAHLEELKSQTEDIINSRDIAMNVLRDKAVGYQERIRELTELADGRDLEAVVEDIRGAYGEEFEEEKRGLMRCFAVDMEQANMQRQEEVAVLRYELGLANSKLAERETHVAELEARLQEEVFKQASGAQCLDEERDRYSQLMQASDNERRRLLKKIEGAEKDVAQEQEKSALLKERLEQQRIITKTSISNMQSLAEDDMGSLKNEKRELVKQLTRSREQAQQLTANNEELQSKVKRMKDDQKHFQQRLEERVAEQVKVLIENYSVPFNTVGRTQS